AVRAEASLNEALTEMSRKGLGMTAVIDEQRRLLGVFTDGDLRRALDNRDVDLRSTPLAQLMTHSPRTIAPQRLA
ncbi:arabinose 5-phosphate isomerase, partial [mine drainage metagenome]